MRATILKKLAHWHASYPWRMLFLILLLTFIFMMFASNLTVTMRTSDLLPENDPKVVQFNKILDEFVTATSLVVLLQGEEESMKKFADELAPKILELRDNSQNDRLKEEIESLQKKKEELKTRDNKQTEIDEIDLKIEELQKRINFRLFQRVDYKAEIDFLKNHALMLIKEDDLKNTKELFMDPNLSGLITNLNNSMEKEYVGQEESISTREKENGAVIFLDGIQNLVEKMKQVAEGEVLSEKEIQQTADRLLFGEPYMLSYDKEILLMVVVPNFTLMDRDYISVSVKALQSILDEQLKDYPGLEAGLTSSIAREHDEQTHSAEAIGFTSFIAIIFILILLIISFRMILAPVLAVLTLIFGVTWALGASWLAVGQLNMITSMMSVVLLGLGIDFAIHFISSFSEWRAAGDDIAIALEKTFLKSGKGVITGALTTACAFLTLMISQARGMREMGIVVGIGLLSIMLTSFLVLPVMLVLKERFMEFARKKIFKKEKTKTHDISFQFLGRTGNWLSKRYIFTIIAAGIITLMLMVSALNITWDDNYMSADPKDWTSIALMDTIKEKFDLSIEYSLILADDVEQSREFAEKLREMGSVALTDDISIYLPSPTDQQKRIPYINEVRQKMLSSQINSDFRVNDLVSLKKEIDRLQMNIIEMQDMAFLGGQDKVDTKCNTIVGDPDNPDSQNIMDELLLALQNTNPAILIHLSNFQKSFAPHFKSSVVKMSSTKPIKFNDLPVTILDRYSNKTRDQFLVSVYPAGDLWQKETVNRFVADLEQVSERATGAGPLGVALINIFGRDGRNAILLTLVLVFLLLWIDFKKPLYALTAMIPLALGVFWMVGFMNLSGMQLSIMNVMGLPMIVGIGIDDGVHILHRWLNEGRDKIHTIFASTGKAILLTTLTTMFAFGSLLFSSFPGWIQFGGALALGVGTCFLTTVIILPAILGLIERKKQN